MAYYVEQVILPTSLQSVENGKLSNSLLRTIGPNYVEKLTPNAAYAWEALRASALDVPNISLTTGNSGGYRTYQEQVDLFLDRYLPTYNAGTTTTSYKDWNGTRYYKKIGVAEVATPGKSYHGLGLAIDLQMSDGSPLTTRALNWLKQNSYRFGFSWEIQSEPWHLRYFLGDKRTFATNEHMVSGITDGSPAFAPAFGRWGNFPYFPKARIKYLSRGNRVLYLKGFLKRKLNRNVTYINSDLFDYETLQSVKQFQQFFGIANEGGMGYTGIVGPNTLALIDYLIADT